jgi:hypothetical protein
MGIRWGWMFIFNVKYFINVNLHQIIFKLIIEGWKTYLSKINNINNKHFLTFHIHEQSFLK